VEIWLSCGNGLNGTSILFYRKGIADLADAAFAVTGFPARHFPDRESMVTSRLNVGFGFR